MANVVEVVLKLKNGKIVSQYTRASDKLKKQNEKLKNSFKKTEEGSKKLRSSMLNIVKVIAPMLVGYAAITAAFRKFGQMANFVRERTEEFEKTMSRIKAIAQPTAKGFSDLSAKARQLGESTAFSASQAGAAFVELGKLGLKTNQIIEASAGVLNLAAASQAEMATAAVATAEVLAQFGLNATESDRVVDVMAKSFTNSALDMEKFGESMKFVGATASQMGFTLEDTGGAMATLANQGYYGSMAGTALRRIMLALADPASKAGRAIGLTADDTRNFAERLADLQATGLSPTEIKDTFGLLATTAAGILIKGAQNVKRFDKMLQNAEGTAKAMAETMLDNVEGATTILKSAQEGLALAIGSSFGKEKQKRIEEYTKLVKELTTIVKIHSKDVETLGGLWNRMWTDLAETSVKHIRTVTAFLDEEAAEWHKHNIVMATASLKGIDETNKNVLESTKKYIERETALMNAAYDRMFDTLFPKLAELKKEAEKVIELAPKPAGTHVKAGALTEEKEGLEKERLERLEKERLERLEKGKVKENEIGNKYQNMKYDSLLADTQRTAEVLDLESQRKLDCLHEEYLKSKPIFDKQLADARARAAKEKDIKQQVADAKSRVLAQSIALGQAMLGDSEEAFYVSKAIAAAEIVVNTVRASMAALAPPPLGLGPLAGKPLAAWTGIQGALALGTVAAQTIKGYAKGGVVPGVGNKDTVPAMLTPGETVIPKGASIGNTFSPTIIINNSADPDKTAAIVGDTVQEQLRAFAENQRETAILMA